MENTERVLAQPALLWQHFSDWATRTVPEDERAHKPHLRIFRSDDPGAFYLRGPKLYWDPDVHDDYWLKTDQSDLLKNREHLAEVHAWIYRRFDKNPHTWPSFWAFLAEIAGGSTDPERETELLERLIEMLKYTTHQNPRRLKSIMQTSQYISREFATINPEASRIFQRQATLLEPYTEGWFSRIHGAVTLEELRDALNEARENGVDLAAERINFKQLPSDAYHDDMARTGIYACMRDRVLKIDKTGKWIIEDWER